MLYVSFFTLDPSKIGHKAGRGLGTKLSDTPLYNNMRKVINILIVVDASIDQLAAMH